MNHGIFEDRKGMVRYDFSVVGSCFRYLQIQAKLTEDSLHADLAHLGGGKNHVFFRCLGELRENVKAEGTGIWLSLMMHILQQEGYDIGGFRERYYLLLWVIGIEKFQRWESAAEYFKVLGVGAESNAI